MGAAVIRVLVVDDDVRHLDVVARGLRLEGFEVETSASSLGVSNLARKFAPDVVLLDVNIPALSGDRLAELLRQGRGGETLRLVLFSACDEDELRSLANRVAADSWIQKGCDSRELASHLRRVCGREPS